MSRTPEEEILHQAAKLFAKKRFEGTSTREIAEASGLRQSSLFHYFASKEDILVALSEQAHVHTLANLERIVAGPGGPAVKLYLVVEAHMRVACGDRGAWRAVMENSHSLSWGRFRRYLTQEERYSGGIRELIAAGIAEGTFVDEPAGLAAARILGMCNWSLRWYKRSGPLSEAEIAADFAQAAIRSLLRSTDALDPVVAEATELIAAGG
jgi:AcrR family transcriptional regulator